MIAYRVLRAFARLALRWFYREIEVVGIERLPERGPVLLASNHPNALVDALVIGCTVRRRVTLTAKATLLDHPVTRAMFGLAGVVPLRRTSDDVGRGGTNTAPDPARNAHAFAAVLDVLERGGVVLLFPEGKSHSDPMLAPLKTGLARIALMARDERDIRPVSIIPIGLTFERKWEPRSRVAMHVGMPILLGPDVPNDPDGVSALTRRVDEGLRHVTLNFETRDDAVRALAISTLLAELLDEFRPLRAPDPPLADSIRLAKRVSTVSARLPHLAPEVSERVGRFLARLTDFERTTRLSGIAVNDVQMSTRLEAGAWFMVRELTIAVLAGPLALWGRVNHWVPLRLARWFAVRSSRTPDEPAMRTIVAGLALVLAFYVAQTAVVAWSTNWWVALAYAATLPPSATSDIRYTDRRHRAVARIRTYLRLRREPALRERLLTELAWLRSETGALDALLAARLTDDAAPALGPA